jgi:diadenosine tetraphosphate (Ap4A) HIT family hydrolase
VSTCKFCALIAESRLPERLPNLVLETERVVVVANRRPVAPGHVTLILKAHHGRIGTLRDDDLSGFGTLAGRIAAVLENEHQPRRVVFLGDGKPSAHLHFHLIPEVAESPLDLGAVVTDLNLTARANTLDDGETTALVARLRRAIV